MCDIHALCFKAVSRNLTYVLGESCFTVDYMVPGPLRKQCFCFGGFQTQLQIKKCNFECVLWILNIVKPYLDQSGVYVYANDEF